MSEYTPDMNDFMDFIGNILGSVDVKVTLTKDEWDLALEAINLTYEFIYLKDEIEPFMRGEKEDVKEAIELIEDTIAVMPDDSDITISISTRQFANMQCSVDFAKNFIANQLKPSLRIFHYLDEDNLGILDAKVEELKDLSKELESKFNIDTADLDNMPNSLGFLNL